MSTDKKNISIVGAGLMGHGIALTFAKAGYTVNVFDPIEDVVSNLTKRIENSLHGMGIEEQGINKILDNIQICSVLEECVGEADIVIEAAPEKIELKKSLFSQIESVAPNKSIFASNTSVIPITKIMGDLQNRERALGTHWWNPPHMIPLVEVIKTKWTSDSSINIVMNVLKDIGKTAVCVQKDIPGFVGNRLQHALWREAISLVENGVCDAESIDTVVKSSFGRRLAVLGPLENVDLIGTDLTLDIHENVLFDLNNSSQPSKYLRELVQKGRLGMKTNHGFKKWNENEPDIVRSRILEHLKKLEEILV